MLIVVQPRMLRVTDCGENGIARDKDQSKTTVVVMLDEENGNEASDESSMKAVGLRARDLTESTDVYKKTRPLKCTGGVRIAFTSKT